MKRSRFDDWINPNRENVRANDVGDTDASFRYLLSALRNRSPAMWSANLLELSRHFTSAVYLAVNTLANQAAAADAKVFEETPDPDDGDIELPHSEQVIRLLHNPNNDDSLGDLLYQITQQLSLTGIALIWMPQTNGLGEPTELYVIPSASAMPLPPSPLYQHGAYAIQPYMTNGWLTGVPTWQGAAGARIPAEQVIRCKNHHPYLRYDGYAVLSALNRQIDTIDSIDLARWQTQQKGVDPTVSLEFDPNIIDPAQQDLTRIREQLEALYSGPLGKKVWLNPVGSKITKISQTPAEMAWTEGWAQLTDFALACYGVPKSVAGLQDDVSYATLFASMKQFYLLSLQPLLKKIADKFTKHLVRPFFGEDLYLTLEGQKIEDEELLEKQLSTDLQAGIRRKNEWRKLRGLKPLDGPEGEEFVGGKGGEAPQQSPSPSPFGDVTDPDQAAMDSTRPENDLGEGSLGPMPDRFSKLLTTLERAKTRGTALPLLRM